jgi:hypothetical protein
VPRSLKGRFTAALNFRTDPFPITAKDATFTIQ